MFKPRHFVFLLIILISICLLADHSDNLLIQAKINKKQTFYLKVVTDKHFRYYYKWQELVRDIIENASKEFDSQLRIRFEIKEFEEIETTRVMDILPSLKKTMSAELIALAWRVSCFYNGDTRVCGLAQQVDPGDCDFVVGFSGERFGEGAGWAIDAPGRYTLITYLNYSESPLMLLDYFVHEMGHLLGAGHVEDIDSVMCGGENSSSSLKFDEKSKKLIFKNKWRNFKKMKIEIWSLI